jgi:hypothetical protein
MKKTKNISLVLITAALASCDKQLANPKEGEIPYDEDRTTVYMRSDTTEDYAAVNTYNTYGNLWYYAFMPDYVYYNGGYYNYYNNWCFPNRFHSWNGPHTGYYNNHPITGSPGHYYGPRTVSNGGFGHRSSAAASTAS